MRFRNTFALVLAGFVLAGCGWILPNPSGEAGPALMWIQSVLVPRGSHAEPIATLSWVLFIGGGVIFLVVMTLTAYASLARPDRAAWLGRPAVVIGGGIVFPVVTLTALLAYGLFLNRDLVTEGPPALRSR